MAKRAAPSASSSSQPAVKKVALAQDSATKETNEGAPPPPTTSNGSADWKSSNPTWSDTEVPQGEFGRLSVDKWCLLPPYDTSITEPQWRKYYMERCELDLVNTCQTFPFERVSCDELGSTPNLLRAMGNALSAEIYGAVIESDEDKVKLARSIRGSGYLLRLEGAYKDDSPRTIDLQSRIYSPYAIGTSVDLAYSFHLERNIKFHTELLASPRTIADCLPSRAVNCAAVKTSTRASKSTASDSAVRIFGCSGAEGSQPVGCSLAKLLPFEDVLFGCSGWLSPHKLLHLLLSSAAVLTHFKEDNRWTVLAVTSKFLFASPFPAEDNKLGRKRAREDEKLGSTIEDEELDAEIVEEMTFDTTREELKGMCLQERLLVLARKHWTAVGETKEDETTEEVERAAEEVATA